MEQRRRVPVKELNGGDQFCSSKFADVGAHNYVKLAYELKTQGGGFLNAVSLTDGQPTLFQDEDVVDLIRHPWEFDSIESDTATA